MTKFKIPGRDCTGCTPSGDELEFQDEGASLGSATVVDFVGAAVTATKAGSKVTVTVTGGGGSGTFQVIDYTGFEAGGGTFPAQVEGIFYRLVFASPGTPIDLNGVQYTHNTLIFWHADASLWGSISANFGT